MLDQPAFETAAFHTGYLDEDLQQRQGEPFVAAEKDEEEVAAIAAALHMASRPDRGPSGASHGTLPRMRSGDPAFGLAPQADSGTHSWKARARIEGLRA
jgi:hypothetical protein